MIKLESEIHIPKLGQFATLNGMQKKEAARDGVSRVGIHGVRTIYETGDGKVDFISTERDTVAYVGSEMGMAAYYPILQVEKPQEINAVLMDLDGTTVKSEEFWIYLIEKTVKKLLNDPRFSLEQTDIPYVSGHSVSEHLLYCINKYCKEKDIEEAKDIYYNYTEEELREITEGRGNYEMFKPTEGLKEFLLQLKDKKIKIGLVTSGLYSKAYPEIAAAFNTMNLGDPRDFYDCIITAGQRLCKGSVGTMGELEAKPHPWLYAETYLVGLNIPFDERNTVIGIEDSGAGVCSVRLANIYTVGVAGGNIEASGTRNVCNLYEKNLFNVMEALGK